MTEDLGGAKIYLKREDLNHTGAHKINNVLGQALLAKKMGKTRLIAETGYSFPSGHSMISMAFFGLLVWMVWTYEKDRRFRLIWCTLFSLIIVMVGVSRIYLGVHYASDVLAGFCVSLIWLAFYTKVVAPAFMAQGE